MGGFFSLFFLSFWKMIPKRKDNEVDNHGLL